MTDTAVVRVPLRRQRARKGNGDDHLEIRTNRFRTRSQRELVPASTRHGQFRVQLAFVIVIGPSSEHRSYVDTSRDANEFDIKPSRSAVHAHHDCGGVRVSIVQRLSYGRRNQRTRRVWQPGIRRGKVGDALAIASESLISV